MNFGRPNNRLKFARRAPDSHWRAFARGSAGALGRKSNSQRVPP